ncbi:hypothetical protein [Candidatus Amarolinea dominans]|uniref:hypothetical protein n=1 Tax=Candidatus Amarolinea dominans TaxID=3140696 RepID=UPI00313755CE|nr:hypothetical protein [Anaerolineae bacterium]
MGYVDDDFVNSFTAITSNPLFVEQQIKALFSTPLEQNKEALGSILTPQTLPLATWPILLNMLRMPHARPTQLLTLLTRR